MTEFDLYMLHPTSSFHLGERGVGMEESSSIFHSDSLFGAISWAWDMLHGTDELEAMLDLFRSGDVPFVISSAFPYAKDLMLFPRPLNVAGEMPDKISKARIVSHGIFERMLNGKELTDPSIIHGGDVLLTGSEKKMIDGFDIEDGYARFWKITDTPRVVLDRSNRSSEIYHVGEVSFSEGCGLFFLVDFMHSGIKQRFEAALRLLGDEGVGGERSSGKGGFDLRCKTLSLSAPDSRYSTTISLYHPTKREVEEGVVKSSRYKLVSRRGWISSPSVRGLRKKSVRMMAEGSILPIDGKRFKGSLVDVTPEKMTAHKVYRYGLAFEVSAKVRDHEV